MKIINLYLLIINTISFMLMGFDKLAAIINKRRISEKKLITLSIIGGTLGTTIAMFIFRHKINKIKFKLLIPLTIVYIAYYNYIFYI